MKFNYLKTLINYLTQFYALSDVDMDVRPHYSVCWKTGVKPLTKISTLQRVLMDLSKAFDCLPHNILLNKLSAYGVFPHSVALLKSYLSSRKQQIKVNNVLSGWADIHKGVPQGSIQDPLLFNVFINDIFLFVKNGSLYYYADDNTLSFCSPDYDLLISTLESESKILIEWFRVNKMQANPYKFQVMIKTLLFIFKILILLVKKTFKLHVLGIEIDYELNFDVHVSSNCRKASQQLNVLKRLGSLLK